MALSNFTDINSAVASWLNRVGASDVTSNSEDFIQLAQRRIQRDVRVPPMEKLNPGISIVAGRYPIPSSMLDVKELVASDGRSTWVINRGTYAEVKRERDIGGAGPVVFDTVAGNFEFGPEPSAGVTVDLVFYQELDFISSTVASNWFSLYSPELVLYGALAEAAVFIKDPEMEAVYERKFQQAKDQLMAQKLKAEWSGQLEIRRK